MAWKDLSIAQRSQLMNIMRHNGISSLSEMRRLYDLSFPSLSSLEENTFNMQPEAPVYADGGNKFYNGSIKKSRIARGLKRIKEEANAARGSFEEFVREKVQPIRDAALKTSRERTEPVPVGKVRTTGKELEDEINRLYLDAVRAYRNADAYANAESYEDAVYNYGATPSREAFESDDRSQREHARMMEKRLEARFEQDAMEYESGKRALMREGETCAQTGTNSYGQQYTQSGNQTIFANPELAGLFQIPFSEAQPGDFIQALREDGTPYHGMILDSKNEKGVNLYNYSDGGIGQGHYEKAVPFYPSQDNEQYRNAYRFAGTPADSTRWRQEWLASQQRFGGKKFEGGGYENPYTGEIRQGKKWTFIDHYLADNPKVAHGFRKLGKLVDDAGRIVLPQRTRDVEINPRILTDFRDLSQQISGTDNPDSAADRMSRAATPAAAIARVAKPILGRLNEEVLPWAEGLRGFANKLRIADRIVNMGQFIDDFATPVDQFAKGGHKIHIKKANRGKFTALKKRTGHSASWFKAHGTPAQKKMAVFALNAKKWKHAHGGIKF